METFVGKQYKLIKKLGSGSFGDVFLVLNTRTQEEYAAKLESSSCKSPQLFYQAKIINTLANDSTTTDHGLPRLYYCGSEGEHNVMVMDLFEQSLEDIFNNYGKKFDTKTTLLLGYQMIERIEYIHNRNYIHRDIKPDNFVMGRGKKSNKLFIIDFGLAKKFVQKDGTHIPYKDNKSLTGTARYASLNTHLGIEQGRRDDVEGIANVLLYLAKGSVPWQNMKANGKKEKYEKIMDKKLAIPLDKLCQNVPNEIKELFSYSRDLEFEDKPDYNMLKNLFKNAMNRQSVTMEHKYCWRSK